VNEVVALTCTEPPGEATRWIGRAMAKTVGLSMNPPTHAVAMSIDEKSQI